MKYNSIDKDVFGTFDILMSVQKYQEIEENKNISIDELLELISNEKEYWKCNGWFYACGLRVYRIYDFCKSHGLKVKNRDYLLKKHDEFNLPKGEVVDCVNKHLNFFN